MSKLFSIDADMLQLLSWIIIGQKDGTNPYILKDIYDQLLPEDYEPYIVRKAMDSLPFRKQQLIIEFCSGHKKFDEIPIQDRDFFINAGFILDINSPKVHKSLKDYCDVRYKLYNGLK